MEYWWKRVEEVSPVWTGLRDACRDAGIEVMYTVIQSLTADGRDQSLDYKISGFHVPPGSFDAQVSTSEFTVCPPGSAAGGEASIALPEPCCRLAIFSVSYLPGSDQDTGIV